MSKIDLTNLNKVDTDLVLPSTSENTSLQKLQENKWGSILNNQTFKTLNNNIKLLKDSLIETINTLNNENSVSKNKYINDDNNIISLGDRTKKLNFLTTQIQVNGVDTEFLTSQSLSNISNIAYKDRDNTFTYPINTNQYNINSNQLITDDYTNINIGNSQRKLNLKSSDGKLYLNGVEFKGGSNDSGNKTENINDYIEKKLYGKDVSISFRLLSLNNIDKSGINDTVFGIEDNFSDKFTDFKIYSGDETFEYPSLYQKREYIKDSIDSGNKYVRRNKITFYSPNFNFLNKLLFDIENGNDRSTDTDKLKCIKFNFKCLLEDDKIIDEDVVLYKVFTNNYFKEQYQGTYKVDPIFVKDNLIANKDGWYISFVIPIKYIKSNKDEKLNNSYLFIFLYYNYRFYKDGNRNKKIPREAMDRGFFFEFAISKTSQTLDYIENFPVIFNDSVTRNNYSKKISIIFSNIEKIYGSNVMYDIEKIQYRDEIYANV